MQKKVLIPLLMAGTATVPALADINIGFPESDKWTQSGTTGDQNYWSRPDSPTDLTEFSNVIGTGEIRTSVNLPKGTFRLSFVNTENIKVFVDGKEVEHVRYYPNEYEFAVETAGDIAIVIKPAEENNPCSFTGQNLALVIDGEGIANALEQSWYEIRDTGLRSVAYDDIYAEAEVLREERRELQKLTNNYKVVVLADGSEQRTSYVMVFNDIRSLDNRNLDDETLRIYNEYELYNTPNAPAAALANLAVRRQTYNDKVDAENAAWAAYEANMAKCEELIAGQKSLLSNDSNSLIDVKQLRAEIDAWQVVDEAVKQPLYEALAAIEAKVEAYGEAIKTAYYVEGYDEDGKPVSTNVALREAIVFESQEEALRTELANLQAQLKQDVSDYEVYYKVNFLMMDKLDEVLGDYTSTIYHPEAVDREKKYSDEVYQEIIANGFRDSVMSEAAAIQLVNYIKESCQIENVAGASEYNTDNGCEKKIQDAIDKLTQHRENYIDLVTTQDANMVDAQAEIKSMRDKWTMFNSYEVPNDNKEAYKEKLTKAKELIDDLDEYVEQEYAKHTLKLGNGTDYAYVSEQINDLFGELPSLAGDPIVYINYLQKMLDDARAKVVQVGVREVKVKNEKEGNDGKVKLEPATVIVNVTSKFDGTFAALQKAIDDIDTIEEGEAAIQKYEQSSVAGQIQWAVDNAEAMANKFEAATVYIDVYKHGGEIVDKEVFGPSYTVPYDIGLFQVKGIVKEKGIDSADIEYGDPKKKRTGVTVPEVVDAKAAFDVSPFEERLAEYDDALSKANAAESQEAWQLIDELLEVLREPVNGNWYHMFGQLGQMQQSWRNFVYDCTGLNREYVYRQYSSLQEKVYDAEEARVTNIETVDFTDIDEAILKADQKQETLYVKLPSLKTEAEAADNLYKDALAAIYVQEDRVADLVANQDAFKALTVKVQGLEDRLAGLREYNETNSVTPGKEFFEGKIEEIEKEIDALTVKITKAVNNEAAVELTPEYNKEIADLDAEISSTWTNAETNNRVHNEQLALEKEVRIYIEDLIAEIEAEIEADENKQDLAVVQEWLETLNGLLSKDMVQANIMVTNAYGDGLSKDMNAEITAEYDRIKEVAKGIYDVYADELHKAVVAANAETTAAWPVDMIGLDNLYRDGIRKYNYFYYELENAGWREYISEAIRRHQSLFEYYDKIKNLNEEGLAAVAKWNRENHVITDTDWAEWTGKRDQMWDDIIRDVRAMIDDMNNLAENEEDETKGYYPENLKAAKDAIAEAEAALTAAGIDTEYLEPAKEYLHEAEFKYWSVDNNGTDLSFAMDDIATVLDQIIPNINVQAYAQESWAEVYAAAQERIDDLREELNSYQFADAAVKAAQTKIFNDNVKDATALNNTATTKPNLVDFYKSYCERLQGYLDNMAQAVKTVKESNDLAVENQNIYNDFITWYNGVDADLDALRAYCGAMAGCFNQQGLVDALQEQLDALKTFVETHKGTLSENDIPGRMADFDAALLGGYEEAAGYEKAYLLRKLTETKVAYNDAYQKHATLPEGFTYEEVNADIRKIDDAVAALVFDADDKDAFKDEAVKYEKELADIYNMLQSTWTENPAAAVLAALEARYTTINETIATAKRYLDGCLPEVKAQYPDAYKQYEDALNAERAAWQGEGTHVMDREPFHNKVLDEIALEVSNLAGKITIAEEKAQAEAEKIRVSEARYEVLKAQYDGLVEEFEAAKDTVEGYGNGISESLTNEANRIQNMLNTALNNLNSARAAHSLNNYSQLTYGNEIDAAIDNYVKRGATQLANLELNKAKTAERNASTALTTQSIVPADRAVLMAEYETANSKLQSLLDETNRANVARLNEIAEEARALVEKFNSITERANESSFVPGNVNMDEDGEVNAVDVQALINLIGEGETYESLYAANPRQACAADVAGNKVLDIADVTALIQLIMGDEPQVLKVRARIPGVTGDDHLTIALVGEENGLRRYALSLTNTTEFIGAQFDIRTSGNARIVSMEPAERTASHDVYMFENIDGARAVMASMENAVFAGNDGVVMYVDVEGKGELTVQHAAFADRDNVTHLLDKAHTSSINAIIDGFKDGASRIYDAAGRAYNRLQKGINIIRHKDGTVTKEMHK